MTDPVEWVAALDVYYDGWASSAMLFIVWAVILAEFAYRDQFTRGWIVASAVAMVFAALLLPVGLDTFRTMMIYAVMLVAGIGMRYFANR